MKLNLDSNRKAKKTNVIAVVWDDYIVPLGLNDSVEYWSGPYMYDLLAILGLSDANVVAGMLEDMYFYDWQIGSQEDMTPGVVDVSSISIS